MSIEAGSVIIPTSDGFSIRVSSNDAEQLSNICWRTFSVGKKRYARASVNGRRVLIHRFLVGLNDGDTKTVDHINGDSLDNRRENLRVCSPKENSWNRRVTNALSGFHGVVKQHKKYIVKFRNNEELIYLGAFDSAVQAAHEYNKKIVELRGKFAVQNSVDPSELLYQLELVAEKMRIELKLIEGEINELRTFH